MGSPGGEVRPLEYAVPRRRKPPWADWFFGTLGVGVVCLLLRVIAWDWARATWYGQFGEHRRAMDYAQPAARVAYDEHADRARALLDGAGGEYRSVSPVGGAAGTVAAAFAPRTWPALDLAPAVRQTPALLYLHERVSPGGVRRLVSVAFVTRQTGTYRSGDVEARAWEVDPVTDTCPPGVQSSVWLERSPAGATNAWRLRIFFGQSDPADASRFSAAYEVEGKQSLIEGQLIDVPGGAEAVLRLR